MAWDHLPFEAISEADLQRLVDDRVEEHKGIDFKETLPGGKDSDKKEFLADVSSFANAAGGDLVYGVAEKQSVAVGIRGLTEIDADAEIRRIEQSILTGIAPRINGIRSRAVPLSSGALVIIVRVPSSWAGPHMITFQEWSRFYSRNSKGKYPMDVFEIRAAFLASETMVERLRAFRVERFKRIRARETPVQIPAGGSSVVLHLVPFSALRPAAVVDLAAVERTLKTGLRPISTGGGWNTRINFDGFLTVAANIAQPSYVQLFRNGCIEAVDLAFLARGRNPPRSFIFGRALEDALIQCVGHYLAVLQSVGCQPPVAVMVSLTGVAGYEMVPTEQNFRPELLVAPSVGVDRPDLVIQEVLVEEFRARPERDLRPVFDAIWNACGYPQSPSYDGGGNRRPVSSRELVLS